MSQYVALFLLSLSHFLFLIGAVLPVSFGFERGVLSDVFDLFSEAAFFEELLKMLSTVLEVSNFLRSYPKKNCQNKKKLY